MFSGIESDANLWGATMMTCTGRLENASIAIWKKRSPSEALRVPSVIKIRGVLLSQSQGNGTCSERLLIDGPTKWKCGENSSSPTNACEEKMTTRCGESSGR